MWCGVPGEDNLHHFFLTSQQPTVHHRQTRFTADHLQPLLKPQVLRVTGLGAVLLRHWRKCWLSSLRYFWLWCFLRN